MINEPQATKKGARFEESTLYLFSSGRALQSFYQGLGDGFLPQAMTFASFLKTVKIYPNLRLLPDSMRPIMLSLAVSNVEVEKLGFEQNFLAFLEHSSFFLTFFDELASSNVTIDSLSGADTYAEYDDHLALLKRLKEAYEVELEKRGFVDKTSLYFSLYEEFLRRFNQIIFRIDGFLSHQEISILDRVCEIVDVIATFEVDRYNVSYYQRLGILPECESGYLYEMRWNGREILLKKELREHARIEAFCFDDRLSQASLALERVHAWVGEGVSPESIAIVLPSEDFSDYLRLFDKERNLNYAMGESPKNSQIYKRIKQKRDELESHRSTSLFEIPPRGIDSLYWLKDEFDKMGLSEESNLFGEAIVLLSPLRDELDSRAAHEIVELVLRIFLHTKIDDVGGGRIRVLGVLETRGIELSHIVVVDFNEGLIPKPSDKDIFLNSTIRKRCGLPTRIERENLQKHYYLSLFLSAQEVALACVKNDDTKPSRLLHELGIKPKDGAQIYKNTLLKAPRERNHFLEEITGEINVASEVFSHTRLKTFLECKRRYYYHYVRKYSERNVEVMQKDRGILVHDALKASFEHVIAPGKRAAVFAKIVHEKSKHDPIFAFEMEAVIKRMSRFFAIEESRAKNGVKPLFLEETIEFLVHGLKFKSIIDRVDLVGDEYFIIDYKVKSIVKADSERMLEKSTDFQFALYTLALREKVGASAKIRAFYYDVLEGEMVEEKLLEDKIVLLPSHLEKLKAHEINFECCLDKKICRLCSYTAICGIEV